MASSSRPVKDEGEEVQEGSRGDSKEISPSQVIPHEFNKPPGGTDEKKEKRQKKKKLCVVPQEHIDFLLNYKRRQRLPNLAEGLAKEEGEDSNFWKNTKASIDMINDIMDRNNEIIYNAAQKLRRDYEAKGCITYEVTDDEDEDEEGASIMASKQSARGLEGKVHRSGIAKHAVAGTKKPT